jgi:transcriptional regulator with XRE-family HTH domain
VDDEDRIAMHPRVAHANHAPAPDWVAERIGPRIRARRIELGLSLRELARRVDVSASFISLVETGRCPPSVDTLCALTSELGISADQLLAEPE